MKEGREEVGGNREAQYGIDNANATEFSSPVALSEHSGMKRGVEVRKARMTSGGATRSS